MGTAALVAGRDSFRSDCGRHPDPEHSWTNVERALANLREAGAERRGIRGLPLEKLEQLVRSSGYFRQKARRLKDFIAFLDERATAVRSTLCSPLPHAVAGRACWRRKASAQRQRIPFSCTRGIILSSWWMPTRAGCWSVTMPSVPTQIRRNSHIGRQHCIARRLCATRVSEAKRSIRSVRPVHPPSAMSAAPRVALAQVYNEMHGLFVQVGKHYCAKQAAQV